MDWQDKVAVVTGASSGIGEAIAERLARGGLKVALIARRAERLKSVAARIHALGGETLLIPTDLTDEHARAAVIEQVHSAWGAINVLVNNAGVGWYGVGADMPWPLAEHMMQLNMTAVVHLTLLVMPEMKARNSGHVINIGSVAGSLPSQGVALYCATKSFLDTFTTSLYRELRGRQVYVSVLRPGAVATEFFERAAAQSNGLRIPGAKLSIRPQRVAERVWALLNKPRRAAFVPGWLGIVPWIELGLGWLIDLLGPLALRRQLQSAHRFD